MGTFEVSDLEMEVRVFPNPSSSYLNVELSSEVVTDVYFELYDVKGQRVFYTPGVKVSGKTLETMDFIPYPNGQYFLLVMDEQNRLIKTFKVQKH